MSQVGTINEDLYIKDVNAAGYVTGKKTGVSAYLPTTADTTITTAGTYYPIEGSFTNDVIENFTLVATPAIRYDGTLTQCMEVDWHASLSADTANTTVHLGIKKNGTLVDASLMAQFLKNADQIYNISGTCVVEMATNDEIQLVVTSDGDGDVLTFEHYTTTITEFFD